MALLSGSAHNECTSNDFVLSQGGRKVDMLKRDIDDWKITFVDTGLHSNVGERLKAVEPLLDGDDMFLANYTDGLSDLPLDKYVDAFIGSDKVGSFISVKPTGTYHLVTSHEDGVVKSIQHVASSGLRINGGFFVFKREIFDYINHGDELVKEPFERLIEKQQLLAYNYDGFWACMDTFRERQILEDMHSHEHALWELWRKPGSGDGQPGAD